MTLIGLTGHAQYGKDTSGAVLVEEYDFKRYAFADQLKSMAFVLNPIIQNFGFPKHPDRLQTLVALMGWEKAKRIEEVRRFLQVLGTEGVRDHIGTNAWVSALEQQLVKDGLMDLDDDGTPHAMAYPAKVVVTDVRFPNEADWIHRYGGVLIRVVRRNLDGTLFDNGLPPGHPSEEFISTLDADHELTATTVDELRAMIRFTVQELPTGLSR